MRRILRHWLWAALVAGAAAVAGCARQGVAGVRGAQTLRAVPAVDVPSLSSDDQTRFNYFFLEAVRQQNAGHYDAAFDLLTHCLEIDSTAAEAYYMKAIYYGELDKDSIALRYLEKAAALRPQNDTYQERVAQFYIGTEDYDSAIDAYERLYENHLGRSDVLEVLLQLYQQKKDYGNMLRTLDRYEQVEGTSEETTLSKVRLYELMEDEDMAYKTLKALSEENPNEVGYRVMQGNWLLGHGRKREAYKIFQAAVREEPDNDYALGSLYDYYTGEGEDSLAQQLRDQILSNKRTPVKTKLTFLQQAIRDNERNGSDSTLMLRLFDQTIAANPSEADIVTLKAAYMDLKHMPEDSVNAALRQVLDIAPDTPGARIQLIQSLWPKRQWADIIALCRPAVQYNPEEMAFYYYMGIAHFQKNERDEALDAFRRGVGEITPQSNPEIVSDFYAIMGDILHQKGKDEEAFAAYDSCLQWKPDHISCLNNYAYYLSEKGRELAKAEQMSYRTIKAEPANPTYLDTYAWILFKQERNEEARIYIDQAIQNDTDSVRSAVIVEHAGDIHAVAGDLPGALVFWEEALQMDDPNIDAALLRRKIKQKRYIKP